MDDPLPLPAFLRNRAGAGGATLEPRDDIDVFDLDLQTAPRRPDFTGVRVYREILSVDEADRLLARIERTPFVAAQSGKQKQHHGAKVNFNKRKVNPDAFRGLPAYVHEIDSRLRQRVAEDPRGGSPDLEALRAAIASFEPTDAFVLRYHDVDASNLDFHRDDDFAYGEVILDLSLETDSVLTFLDATQGTDGGGRPRCVRVPLPARSLAVLAGRARFDWEHAVLAGDVTGRRTSVTLRTLGDSLRASEAGRRILAIARGNDD